ncbi:hypothetical protein [Sorangium sp. So ce131]|uniref:hypothetical protein n=1 Tax=Sorangium sp. So ce131 TaxID=3133282 RepID=UPI003F5DBADA
MWLGVGLRALEVRALARRGREPVGFAQRAEASACSTQHHGCLAGGGGALPGVVY